MSEHPPNRPPDDGVSLFDADAPRRPGSRRAETRRRSGCLPLVVAAVVVVGLVFLVGRFALDGLGDLLGGPADYSGPGSGSVVVEVESGDSSAAIGRTLKSKGVVKSVEAFTDAARADAASRSIQVGFYELKKKMKATDALAVLVDPDNLVQTAVTIPEGLRVSQIVDLLADKTGIAAKRFEKVLDQPGRLGLPDYAEGNPEGYLFPATYAFSPKATPRSMLRAMVDRWQQAAEDAGLEQAAAELGYTPGEVMVVASLVEAEARRDVDRPRVARVIYNRLEGDATGHLLQIDATVNYAHGRNLGARTTEADRAIDSPYNTYRTPGLPPTPIEAPGQKAIEAAAHPASGDWIYYVTVNLRTGETKFASSYAEHQRNVAELNEYCRTQSDRC